MQEERLYFIDFIKTIGFLGLIIAHINPPPYLLYLRSFDVCLLVFISGYLSHKSNIKKIGWIKYIKSRFYRIVLPSWVFCTFFFITSYLADIRWDILMIVKTYLFQRDSLGYVWIFWIYFMLACITPFVNELYPNRRNIILMLLIYGIYEYCCQEKILIEYRLVDYTFYYLIPYGIVYYIGYYYSNLKEKTKIELLMISSILWFSCLILLKTVLNNISISDYKYPPRLYYITYSIMFISILMIMFEGKQYNLFKNKIIVYISQHTMWIYLWHIPIALLFQKYSTYISWYFQFAIAIVIPVIIVYVQNLMLDWLHSKNEWGILKIFRG